MEIKTEFLVIAKAKKNTLILCHKYIITKDEPQARKVSKSGIECRNNTEERMLWKVRVLQRAQIMSLQKENANTTMTSSVPLLKCYCSFSTSYYMCDKRRYNLA